jgi:hypothetical protein
VDARAGDVQRLRTEADSGALDGANAKVPVATRILASSGWRSRSSGTTPALDAFNDP